MSFNDLPQPFVQSYTYDSIYRRTEAKETNNGNQTWKEIYGYDRYGNRSLHAKFLATTQVTADNKTDPTTDKIGSPRVITNSLAEVVARRDFMPFGEAVVPDGTNRTTGLKYNYGDDPRQKFTGYQKDDETDLDFAEARMYQDLHGRFTAVDPLLASGKSANPQTFNRFVYCLNNPLILTDPNGLQVGTATGKVYINNQTGQVGIFPGRVRSGFVPLDHNITTTSTFRGVTHSMSVTPNGWTIGDRVDGQRFAAPAPSAAINNSFENAAVRALARNVVDGFHDGGTGLLQGIANTPSVIWNGLTDGAIRQATGGLYRGPNPFAAPLPFDPSNENARTASYMSAPPIAIPIGAGLAGGSIVNSSPLSLMPEQTSQLSPGAQMITDLVGQPGQATGTVNKAGDLVITGERFKFRVDFKNPGNDVPHMHLQELVDGDWVDAVDGVHRIRPKN